MGFFSRKDSEKYCNDCKMWYDVAVSYEREIHTKYGGNCSLDMPVTRKDFNALINKLDEISKSLTSAKQVRDDANLATIRLQRGFLKAPK